MSMLRRGNCCRGSLGNDQRRASDILYRKTILISMKDPEILFETFKY
jgi:hypothetical protein